jgi:histone acetyltransferase 1
VAEPRMHAYHARLQMFNIWFIDGARYIEANDPKWQIYLAFRRRKSTDRLSLVGWMTVYPFFSYPQSLRMRVSQLLILPPFQKRGICAQLLRALYRDVRSSENIADVTVEDPAPGFQRLRDVVDLKNLCAEFAPLLGSAVSSGHMPEFTPELEQSIRTRLKLWKVGCLFVVFRCGVMVAIYIYIYMCV